MKIDTVRKIDFWAGIPACFLLSLLSWAVSRLFPRKEPGRPFKKFLLIELSEMGSAILAYPTLKALQRDYPGAELYFMIFEKNRASVDILNLVPRENVLTIREKSLGSFLGDVVKTVLRMHREGIDVVFDLELFTRVTAILTFLSGAPVRVGFHRFRMEGLYRGNLHTHKIQYNFQQHISKSFLSFLDVLRYPAKDWPTLDLAIPDNRLETASYQASEAGKTRIREKILKPVPGIRRVQPIDPLESQRRGNSHPGLASGKLCGTGPTAPPGSKPDHRPHGGRRGPGNHRPLGEKVVRSALPGSDRPDDLRGVDGLIQCFSGLDYQRQRPGPFRLPDPYKKLRFPGSGDPSPVRASGR